MFNTFHKIQIGDSTSLENLIEKSVQLVVTSPPYPMIEMWDETFYQQNSQISSNLINADPLLAFELQHQILDKVWAELYRVLDDGCFLCINIGDATRTINSHFRLFSNHARIINSCQKLGFSTLPVILWRKQTNAPNKFMGSGMLPAGAYVTLEHEYILIFRKGNKRIFKSTDDKILRSESGYFWEERNNWFSDVWDFKGTKQNLVNSCTRVRSAAFPFELAHRLINMYSVKNDTVVDPFLGTGTTLIASMASQRNSIGYEIDPPFLHLVRENINLSKNFMNEIIDIRLANHSKFVQNRIESGYPFKYFNSFHRFNVMTKQEELIKLLTISSIDFSSDYDFSVNYCEQIVNENCKLTNSSLKKISSRSPHQLSLTILA